MEEAKDEGKFERLAPSRTYLNNLWNPESENIES